MLLDLQGIQGPIQAVILMNKPYVCDDNDMLTISLVTEEVWKTNFDGQVIKRVVLHFSRLKVPIASVMRF